MSDQAPTEFIRFARSPAFRDKIRYISADARCKNAWRLSTTVPGYFPQYKGFSSFLDTESIRVISCILFHEWAHLFLFFSTTPILIFAFVW